MRARAGTRPVTLEPSMIAEVLSLARHHDDMLKETRQDLFRTETQLRGERRWKWPIRLFCFALGAGMLAAIQNDALMAAIADFFRTTTVRIAGAGNTALASLVAGGVVIYVAVWLVRRHLREPSPEKTARKLMEQFAQRDGVAAYVFSGDETTEDEAASIGALTRSENKTFRQRRLTPNHRTLSSSLTRLLNRTVDDTQHPMLH